MEWIVIASVEHVSALVTVEVPGLGAWLSQVDETAQKDNARSREEWLKEVIRRANLFTVRIGAAPGRVYGNVMERVLSVEIFPAQQAPKLEVLEDGIVEWDNEGSILRMIECANLNEAVAEGKEMQATLNPQLEKEDECEYERTQRQLVAGYAKIRAFVAKEYPHLPPMPGTSDVFSKETP